MNMKDTAIYGARASNLSCSHFVLPPSRKYNKNQSEMFPKCWRCSAGSSVNSTTRCLLLVCVFRGNFVWRRCMAKWRDWNGYNRLSMKTLGICWTTPHTQYKPAEANDWHIDGVLSWRYDYSQHWMPTTLTNGSHQTWIWMKPWKPAMVVRNWKCDVISGFLMYDWTEIIKPIPISRFLRIWIRRLCKPSGDMFLSTFVGLK